MTPRPDPLYQAEAKAWFAHHAEGTQETYTAYVVALTAKRLTGRVRHEQYKVLLRWAENTTGNRP